MKNTPTGRKPSQPAIQNIPGSFAHALEMAEAKYGPNCVPAVHTALYVYSLKDGDKDWDTKCQNCDATPTVHPLQLCGPCCFGEADTAGGNW